MSRQALTSQTGGTAPTAAERAGWAGVATALAPALMLTLTACATPSQFLSDWKFWDRPGPASHAPAPTIEEASPAPLYRNVTFPIEPADGWPSDSRAPDALAQIGLQLLDRGDPARAARFFTDAADAAGADAPAPFRIACLAAAATLHLQLGDLERFEPVATRLREEIEAAPIAGARPEIALLLAVADASAGKRAEVSPRLPWAVRNLFRDSKP